MDLFSLPRPLGFFLGGGGSLDAVQVGMLRALAERDLFPDLVVGTSVGSNNGAVVALDPTGAVSGRAVVVATARRLRELHEGYEPREVDVHDLHLLADL